MRDITDDPSNFNPFVPHHAQCPVRKSRRGRKRSSDNRISLLDYPRKATFWKGGLAGAKNRGWEGVHPSSSIGESPLCPFVVIVVVVASGGGRFLGILRHGSVVLGSWPTTAPAFRPRFSTASFCEGSAAPRAAVARADRTEPRRRAATTHY